MRAAQGASAIATVRQTTDDLLHPDNPHTETIREMLVPLISMKMSMVGISASACVLESAMSLHDNGLDCRVVASGILNHYPEQCQGPGEYYQVNGVDTIR